MSASSRRPVSTAAARLESMTRERDDAQAESAALRAELDAMRTWSETAHHDSRHHLKNVLHLACSLLSLQRNRAASAETRQELDAAVERITVLGAVHGGQGATAVEGGVSVRALLSALCGGPETPPRPARPVIILVELADVTLRIEQATALALIVNELVTNSLRHGFPDGRTGKITVRLARAGRRGWVLTVSDDGVGLGAAGSERGFGLQLVGLMAGQ